jgi:hypothetical protein
MATPVVEVEGILQPDGTLVLDEKPNLPPGRVRVRVQPLLDYTQTDIWRFFEQLWAEQQARGHVPRSKEEIDADIAAARQEDEERALEIERLQEECWRAREQERKPEDS